MKKIRVLLISVFVLFSLSALANDEFIKVRQNVASGLNDIVKDLKDYFKLSEDKLDLNDVALEEQKDKAEALKERSQEVELNPTVLKHGSAKIHPCDYNTQELKWKNNNWVCENPLYKTDCLPSTGEVKVSDGSGGFICKQEGTYKNISIGWGVCNNAIGETHTQVACMFTNSESGKSYQVASGCTNSIPRKEKACGPYGARSTCRCPAGYVYNYNNGHPRCRYTITGTEYRELNYGIGGSKLYWKSKYWCTGACRYVASTIRFYYTSSMGKVVLRNVRYDDGMKFYVNGHSVFEGGSLLKYCETKSLRYSNINKNITRYLKEGMNSIKMNVNVGGCGEGWAELSINIPRDRAIPICPLR